MGKLAPNSATNQNQREFALPGGDLWWQARRMSSETTSCVGRLSYPRLSERQPVMGEIVLWLLGGTSAVMAIWQYASMVSTY